MAKHQRWSDYSEEEIKNIQEKVCCKDGKLCTYLKVSQGAAKKGSAASIIYCDYFLMAHERRNCRPEECCHYTNGSVKRNFYGEFDSPVGKMYVEKLYEK